MPKPIVCLSAQLRQYLELFRPCFSKRQWKYFVTVLLGLIECEERKTLTRLARDAQAERRRRDRDARADARRASRGETSSYRSTSARRPPTC